MIQASTPASGQVSGSRETPVIWGLTAWQLYEAYWRSRGVQCVVRGEAQSLSRSADLYLLLEPGQMVLFDLQRLIDRLVWHNGAVTRVRVVDEDGDRYGERVIVQNGLVERVKRRYRPRTRASYRVLLTARRRIGSIWMQAATRREGWVGARRAVSWSRLDSVRCRGGCFTQGQPAEEQALIRRLVARWPDPAQVLDGIEPAAPGVWRVKGDPVIRDAVLIRPLWLDCGGVTDADRCLVGPAFTANDAEQAADAGRVRVRQIGEIELGGGRRSVRQRRERNMRYAFAKRTFDIAFSLVMLVLGLPVFLVVGLCIAIEDGWPIFYGHTRQGRGGKLFRCWKFRTMYRGSDREQDVLSRNLCDGPQVFIKDDPRVTRVGHLLRRFQIDEAPQFWNVLVGQMSVVGPRPSPDDENQFCPAWRDLRLSVRPGITGLWQLNRTRAPGRDFQEWIRYDVEYVRRASLGLDLKVCLKTVWMLTFGRRETCV